MTRTVTQPTSKTTAVTLNNICGKITMSSATLLAGNTATFVVNNSTVTAPDLIILTDDVEQPDD